MFGVGTQSGPDKAIKGVVIGITLLITIWALWWLVKRMNEVRPTVIYERRKARQAKYNAGKGSDVYLNGPNLEAGNSSVPALHAPQPKRPARLSSEQIGTGTRGASQASVVEQSRSVSGSIRQGTTGSNGSWDAPQGGESYAMSNAHNTPAPMVTIMRPPMARRPS